MSNFKLLHGGLGDFAGERHVPDLAAQPFRPGELPTLIEVALSGSACDTLAKRAAAHDVPTELLLRVAVEAYRHVSRAADEFGQDSRALREHLDHQSRQSPDVVHNIAAHHVAAYGRRLRERLAHRAANANTRSQRLVVRVPETIWAGWSYEAGMGGCGTDDWISHALLASPPAAAQWEAAAAERGCSLGEWIWMTAAARFRPGR